MKKRRVFRWALGLLVVAILAAGLLEGLLRSVWPAAVVARMVEDWTGRVVYIRSLDAGWLGYSDLHGVYLLAADERHVAVYADHVRAEHPWLGAVVLGIDRVPRTLTAHRVVVGRHRPWLNLTRVDAELAPGGSAMTSDCQKAARGRSRR